jgi:hypothetical protein
MNVNQNESRVRTADRAPSRSFGVHQVSGYAGRRFSGLSMSHNAPTPQRVDGPDYGTPVSAPLCRGNEHNITYKAGIPLVYMPSDNRTAVTP